MTKILHVKYFPFNSTHLFLLSIFDSDIKKIILRKRNIDKKISKYVPSWKKYFQSYELYFTSFPQTVVHLAFLLAKVVL